MNHVNSTERYLQIRTAITNATNAETLLKAARDSEMAFMFGEINAPQRRGLYEAEQAKRATLKEG